MGFLSYDKYIIVKSNKTMKKEFEAYIFLLPSLSFYNSKWGKNCIIETTSGLDIHIYE